MTNPIFSYGHSGGCATITGGAFVPAGVWPSAYDGDYLYADFGCGSIFRLEPGAGGFTSSAFASGFGANSVVDLLFAPASVGSALYYTTIGGRVGRIVYAPSPPPPPPPPP